MSFQSSLHLEPPRVWLLPYHHHRCNPDGLTVEQATKKALATWDREPMFHLSSRIEGWDGPKSERHHDYIDVADFPARWRRKKSRSQGQGSSGAEAEDGLKSFYNRTRT